VTPLRSFGRLSSRTFVAKACLARSSGRDRYGSIGEVIELGDGRDIRTAGVLVNGAEVRRVVRQDPQ